MRSNRLAFAIAFAIACGKNSDPTDFIGPPPPSPNAGLLRLVNFTRPPQAIDWYWGDSLILRAQPFWAPYLIGLPVATKLLHARVSSTGETIRGHEVTLPINQHGSLTMPALLAVAIGNGANAVIATAPPSTAWDQVLGRVTFRVLHAGPPDIQSVEVGWSLGQGQGGLGQIVLTTSLDYGAFSQTYNLSFVPAPNIGNTSLVFSWIRDPRTGAFMEHAMANWGPKPQLTEYKTVILNLTFGSCSLFEFRTGNIFQIPDIYHGPESYLWHSATCNP